MEKTAEGFATEKSSEPQSMRAEPKSNYIFQALQKRREQVHQVWQSQIGLLMWLENMGTREKTHEVKLREQLQSLDELIKKIKENPELGITIQTGIDLL